MDDYAGRVLADRYRLPLPPSDEYELTETRAFDTYSGQEVLVRQVPLPEVVEAEVLDAEGLPEGFTARDRAGGARVPGARRPGAGPGTSTRRPADPVVRRALEAAQAAARIPDHPRLDQVFDVFAEGGSLWIVSELVAARPLAALLAERPLTPYRAAEVAADVLTALRALHAHGWVHRNVTARTVLVCDDGRVMLTGLAVGAAEEALCGYDPVPPPEDEDGGDAVAPGGTFAGPHAGTGTGFRAGPAGARGVSGPYGGPGGAGGSSGLGGAGGPGGSGGAQQRAYGGPPALRPPAGGTRPGAPAAGAGLPDPEAARRAAIQARVAGGLPAAGAEPVNGASDALGDRGDGGGDIRAARAGAIAAYRAGARAAARVQEDGQNGRIALPGARPPAAGDTANGSAAQPHTAPASPPGQIADPYGVRGGTAWHGATPRPSGPDPAAQDRPHPAMTPVGPAGAPAGWDDPAGGPPPHRGPATALAAERARQARMAVVGAVTERWAPEQAGPVHENWQLAAPIGPATDLWALGALLFRAVQGHAPYPEESTAELVQMVCAEPPAFAEECGPLRPVVESLLRQDPTERPDVEELRGWLRSLVRSAPEPEAGVHVIAAPPADPSRLPIVRRRGELVRRRRAKLPANSPHGRHKRARQEGRSARSGSPRSLGRTLLLLVLLLLAGAVAYAMLFMPKAGSDTGSGPTADRTGAAGDSAPASGAPEASSEPRPDQTTPGDGDGGGDADSGSPTQSSETPSGGGTQVADGFTLRTDPAGFQVAVANGWERTPGNGRGQVVYAHGDFQLIVVPGRDSAAAYGSDPMVYQREKEYEIQPYRDSTWATASGLKTIQVGGRTMAEGQFTWTGADGRELYVRNLAVLVDGRYHVVQVRGPEAERDEVTRLYEQASATYRPGN
ncbi:protein kinase [Streptomyces griseosporeus]|uniref:protein kinase n=1 Tax=Streptomyces griseosporeus TaxID=1910 RepID=UPI0036FDA588